MLRVNFTPTSSFKLRTTKKKREINQNPDISHFYINTTKNTKPRNQFKPDL